jgi:hypothetical protein
MKTQSTLLLSLLCTGIVASFAIVPSNGWGQAVVSMKIYEGVGPYNVTAGFVSDVTHALINGLPAYQSWTSIPNGSSVNVSNIFVSGNSGYAMYSALAVTSSVPFTLEQINFSSTAPFFDFSGPLGAYWGFTTYTLFGTGISSNGTVYTSGNGNTLVNAAYIIGPSYSYDMNGQSVTAALASAEGICPFPETDTYSINGVNATNQFTYVDPLILLSIFPTNANSFVISWPLCQFNHLQQNLNLNTTNWVAVTNPWQIGFSNIQVVVTNSGTRFYRLEFP